MKWSKISFQAFYSQVYVVELSPVIQLVFCWNWQQCARAGPGLIYLVLGTICLYYLNKVKSGACRVSTACRNKWSVKLQHQTAGIIAQKGANVPATLTEHFYNDWIKKRGQRRRGGGAIDLCYSLFFPFMPVLIRGWAYRCICPVQINPCN